MENGDRQFEKLLEVARDLATSSAASVEIQRQHVQRLDAMQLTLSAEASLLTTMAGRMEVDNQAAKEGRQLGMQGVKDHITAELSKSDRNWRIIAWGLGVLLAASNIFGPLIVRLVMEGR